MARPGGSRPHRQVHPRGVPAAIVGGGDNEISFISRYWSVFVYNTSFVCFLCWWRDQQIVHCSTRSLKVSYGDVERACLCMSITAVVPDTLTLENLRWAQYLHLLGIHVPKPFADPALLPTLHHTHHFRPLSLRWLINHAALFIIASPVDLNRSHLALYLISSSWTVSSCRRRHNSTSSPRSWSWAR